MKRAPQLLSLVLFVALSLFTRAGVAQIAFDTGQIGGTVLQSDGTPVAGVVVRATSLDSSGSVQTTTDAAGVYALTQVPVGDYEVEARYEWSWKLGEQNVTVTTGATQTASFTFLGANVSWTVIRDGVPAANARVDLVEQAPGSCAEADSCFWEDPENGGAGDVDISGASFSVRAYRAGSETSGRSYTATFRATDAAGNPSTATAQVLVPHDQR